MTPNTLHKKLYFGYLIGLLVISGLIYSFISKNTFKVLDKKPREDVQKDADANVTLRVEFPKTPKEYKLKLNTSNSVLDLLDKVRDTENAFYFEVTRYSFGTTIDTINDTLIGNAFEWTVRENNILIQDLETTRLKNQATYIIKPEPIK